MPTPYKAVCYKCGDELDIIGRFMDGSGDVIVNVDPCDKCLERARDEAYADGHIDGAEGKEEE